MGFQGIGDEPIRRIDLQVPATGEIRLVARTLDGAAMQLIGLVVPRLERLLDRQGDLQGQRRDGLEQHAPDRGIEPAARDALTDRFGLRDPATLTDVRGPGGPLAAVIAHGHPIPTDAAHRESLEQRVPLAGGTPASVGPIRLRVLAQPALILFKVLPGDVAEMRVRDQRRPQRALDSTRGTTRGGVETDRWQVAPQLVLEPGMRLDYSTMTARTTVSPRLSAAAQLGRGWRVDGALRLHAQSPGYEKMLQADYFVDLSPDRSRGVKAERAVQGVPGVQRPLPGGFTARLDGYCKRYDDLLVGRLETDDARLARLGTYDVPAALWTHVRTSAQVTTLPVNAGRGRAYGIEAHLVRGGESRTPVTDGSTTVSAASRGPSTHSHGRSTTTVATD